MATLTFKNEELHTERTFKDPKPEEFEMVQQRKDGGWYEIRYNGASIFSTPYKRQADMIIGELQALSHCGGRATVCSDRTALYKPYRGK